MCDDEEVQVEEVQEPEPMTPEEPIGHSLTKGAKYGDTR